jgi:hypothetical protein
MSEKTVGSKMHTQTASSAQHARAILGAWHSGDSCRLQQELDRVQNLHAADAAEEERLELLSEIAREMSSVEAETNDPVYGSLLAHLAFVGPSSRRVTGVSGYGRAAAATLQ